MFSTLPSRQSQSLLNFTGTPTITINGVVPLGDDQQPISDYNAILARIDSRNRAPEHTAD